MTPMQAHLLKLLCAHFAEATAHLEYARKADQLTLDAALEKRDNARVELYEFIDECVSKEEQ